MPSHALTRCLDDIHTSGVVHRDLCRWRGVVRIVDRLGSIVSANHVTVGCGGVVVRKWRRGRRDRGLIEGVATSPITVSALP